MRANVIIGAVLGVVGVWLLVKSVAGRVGIDIQPGIYTGPLRYTGGTKTFKEALGECYDVIYTIDVWDQEFQEFIPPTDPVNEQIETGDLCMVQVLAPCTLYNFEWV